MLILNKKVLIMKKVYTKIKKLETNKQNTLRGDTAYRCYEQMFEGKAFWQQPFDPQKDMDIRLPYDLGTGRKFYGYNLTQLLSYKKPEDKFIPLRYITYKDAQNKGYYIKKGSKSIALENYSKYDMGYAKEQSPNNKTYTKFYKNKTNNWHTTKIIYLVNKCYRENINSFIQKMKFML